jgi:hypothetical protein
MVSPLVRNVLVWANTTIGWSVTIMFGGFLYWNRGFDLPAFAAFYYALFGCLCIGIQSVVLTVRRRPTDIDPFSRLPGYLHIMAFFQALSMLLQQYCLYMSTPSTVALFWPASIVFIMLFPSLIYTSTITPYRHGILFSCMVFFILVFQAVFVSGNPDAAPVTCLYLYGWVASASLSMFLQLKLRYDSMTSPESVLAYGYLESMAWLAVFSLIFAPPSRVFTESEMPKIGWLALGGLMEFAFTVCSNKYRLDTGPQNRLPYAFLMGTGFAVMFGILLFKPGYGNFSYVGLGGILILYVLAETTEWRIQRHQNANYKILEEYHVPVKDVSLNEVYREPAVQAGQLEEAATHTLYDEEEEKRIADQESKKLKNVDVEQ